MREITGTSDSLEISEETFPDNASISDLDTDQSVLGSPFEHSAGSNKGLPVSFVLTQLSLFHFIWLTSLLPLSPHYASVVLATFHDYSPGLE